MTKADERKEAQLWKKREDQILDMMILGHLSRIPKKDVEEYLAHLAYVLADVARTNLYAHSTIQRLIGKYLKSLGWEVRYEVAFEDEHNRHRFDIVAQKDAHEIIVEVKAEFDGRDLGQVMEYVHSVRRQRKRARVFLGTDITNLYRMLEGSRADIISEYARLHKMGFIFADSSVVAVIPAEFIQTFSTYWKRL